MNKYLIVLLLLLRVAPTYAQKARTPTSPGKKKIINSMYFSWGYNKEWYTRSNIQVSQPTLNSNYTFNNVKTVDNPGWTTGIFNKDLTIPQYSYRIGYMFDEERGWGVELNFDHTKHIVKSGQDVRVTGTLQGSPVDTMIRFQSGDGFYYFLNNGANFFLFNLVKRFKVLHTSKERIKIDLWSKLGVGPVVPHVQNQLWGQYNNPGFQLGGWNVGAEAALTCTFFNYVYLEYSNKLDYARYSGLKVYEGVAKEAFGTYEMVLSLGFRIPTLRK